MKKAFLICPVRGLDKPEDQKQVVKQLESSGWSVHWPHRDTNQNDKTGLAICTENREAIKQADCVFVIWNGESQGSFFDLGMAFVLEKPIKIIRSIPLLGKKSFQDMLAALERSTNA